MPTTGANASEIAQCINKSSDLNAVLRHLQCQAGAGTPPEPRAEGPKLNCSSELKLRIVAPAPTPAPAPFYLPDLIKKSVVAERIFVNC